MSIISHPAPPSMAAVPASSSALPDLHPGIANGQKVIVPVRVFRHDRDGVLVSRDYDGPIDSTVPTVWLPPGRVTLVDVSCLGHARCVMPVWLYRKVRDQLAGQPAKPLTEPCWRCGHPTPSDGNVDPLLCPACQRMTCDMALHEATGTIRALRQGLPPFDCLQPAERAEQLAALIDTAHPAARGAVANLPNEQLIDVIATGHNPEMVGAAAAELADRLDAIPNPDERRRIESDDEQYHRELTMAREAEAAEQSIDHNDW